MEWVARRLGLAAVGRRCLQKGTGALRFVAFLMFLGRRHQHMAVFLLNSLLVHQSSEKRQAGCIAAGSENSARPTQGYKRWDRDGI